MTDRDLYRRGLLEKAILDELSTANEQTRDEMRQDMLPGDKVAVPGLGYVQVTVPKPSLQVVDWAAFTAWANEHCPEAFVTQIVMSKPWLAQLLKTGEYIDEAGEVLVPDGVGTVQGTPQLRVVPTDEAHELARGLLGTQLAIDAGERP